MASRQFARPSMRRDLLPATADPPFTCNGDDVSIGSVWCAMPRSMNLVSRRREGLPSFRKPPVNEVVLGVTLKPLARMRITDLGELYTHLRADYPQIEEQPPYYPPIEQLGPSGFAATLNVELSVVDWPRLWFLSSDNERLIQFQRNWLAFNWRKINPESEYQRWQAVRDGFVNAYKAIEGISASLTGDRLEPLQCEVSYINEIGTGDAGVRAGELWRVL